MRGKGREDIGIGKQDIKGWTEQANKNREPDVGPLRMRDMPFQEAF